MLADERECVTLFDQGDNEPLHPDVAKFLNEVRGKSVHQIKFLIQGKITTKCGIENAPKAETTVWGSEVTCQTCSPKRESLL